MNHQLPIPGPSREDIIKHAKEQAARITPEQKEGRRQLALSTLARHDPIKIDYPDLPVGVQKWLRNFLPERQVTYEDNRWLIFWGLNLDIKTKLYEIPLPDEHKKKFYGILETVYRQMEKLYEKIQQQAEERVKETQDSVKFHKNAHKELDKHLSEMQRDKTLVRQIKTKLLRVFTEAEREKMLHVQAFSEDDLNRSRDNLVKSKTDFLSKIKQCEKAISQLEAEKKPFDKKATELREKLDHDE